MIKSSLTIALALGTVVTLGVGRSYADTVTFNNSSLHPDGVVTIGSNITLTGGVTDAVARINPLAGFSISGSCGPSGNTNFGCLTITTGAFVGPITMTPANDYAYLGGGTLTVVGGIAALSLPNTTTLFAGNFDPTANVVLQFDDICQTSPAQCTGSVSGTLAPGLLNATLAAALGVSPTSLGGDDQNLFVTFTGVSLPATGFPSGTATGNTNQLEVVTPSLQINPTGPAVPEPGSLILLGTGLVTTARLVGRRRRLL